MTVKIQRKIKWINDCNCEVDESILAKASLWKSKKPMTSIKHIYKYGKYAAVTIDGVKTHVHRLLMEYEVLNDIPKEFCIHHLDGNKMNDSIDNLAIMVAGAHNSHHMKGHAVTDKQVEMTVKANHQRKGLKQYDLPFTAVIPSSKSVLMERLDTRNDPMAKMLDENYDKFTNDVKANAGSVVISKSTISELVASGEF